VHNIKIALLTAPSIEISATVLAAAQSRRELGLLTALGRRMTGLGQSRRLAALRARPLNANPSDHSFEPDQPVGGYPQAKN
jgi:hypothetical protein